MFLSTILILSFFKVASLSVDKCVFFGFSETITSAVQKEVLQMLLKNISKISKTVVPYQPWVSVSEDYSPYKSLSGVVN